MWKIKIIIEISNKGPRRQDAVVGYLIECQTSKEPVTINDFLTLEAVTNHEAELTGILKALKRLNKPCEVLILSNGLYFENAVEKGWLENWKKNGWKNAKGNPVASAELWQQIDEELKKHDFLGATVNVGTPYTQWIQREVKRRSEKNGFIQ